MSEARHTTSQPAEALPDELSDVYGLDEAGGPGLADRRLKSDFKPWHHPIKQIVRNRQWVYHVERTISAGHVRDGILRYFTLPGPDLLDIRLLSDVCVPYRIAVEYFGFDAAPEAVGGDTREAAMTESALRQAGRITNDARILPDRLEDLAARGSHARQQLRLQASFDVVNLDLCDHLAYNRDGRTESCFDALKELLVHQMTRDRGWMLFLTTRVEPGLLGVPGEEFQRAINENLRIARPTFGAALAQTLRAEQPTLAAAIARAWSTHSADFVKLYAIGVGKFLLHYFHAQPNHPANVELASAYGYRVYHDEMDMLSLAFRILPDGIRAFDPTAGSAVVYANLEPQRACAVAERADRLQDLDAAYENDPKLRESAVSQTEALLASADYNMAEWREWLRTHPRSKA